MTRRTPADRIAHVEMTEAERWSGSTILLDKWCPRGSAYFLPRRSPLDLGSFGLYLNAEPFIVLHPAADPGPVMASNLAAAYRPEGV